METLEPQPGAATTTGTETEPELEPIPEVEEAFDEIEVDAPRVGIIMGSASDKPTMSPRGRAARARDQIRGPGDLRAPQSRRGGLRQGRTCVACGRSSPGRYVGRAPGGRRGQHGPAGDRSSRSRPRTASATASTLCSPSCRSSPEFRSPASRSMARATRRSSPPASSRADAVIDATRGPRWAGSG